MGVARGPSVTAGRKRSRRANTSNHAEPGGSGPLNERWQGMGSPALAGAQGPDRRMICRKRIGSHARVSQSPDAMTRGAPPGFQPEPGAIRGVETPVPAAKNAAGGMFSLDAPGRVWHFALAWLACRVMRPMDGTAPQQIPPQHRLTHQGRSPSRCSRVCPAVHFECSDSISPPMNQLHSHTARAVVRDRQGHARLMIGALQLVARGHRSC